MKPSYKLRVISYKLLFTLIIYNLSLITHSCFSQTDAHSLYLSALAKDSLKDYAGALTDLDNALANTKNNDSLHILHAKIEAESLNFKDAYAEITEIIKHNTTSFEAYLLRGIIRAKLGNLEGAVHDFTKSLKLNTRSSKAYYNRGLAHAYLDEFKKAIDDFSKAIELTPAYADAWFQRGYWKESMGDYTGSLTDLVKANELNPNNTEILIEMAVANYKLKQNDKACALLSDAKTKGSSSAGELILIYCK
jgi:tetratricopeptide (TPR) repeat protein